MIDPGSISRRDALRISGLGILGEAAERAAGAALTKLSRGPYFHESVVWQHNESGLALHHVYGLAVTKKGTVLAFSEGRIRPGDADPHHIVLKRSTDGGANWSENIFIERSDGSYWREHGQPGKLECWTNTAPLVDTRTGRVFFFYALNQGTKDQSWTRVFYRYSDDDGKTWLPTRSDGSRIEITRLLESNAFGWTFHMPGPGHGIRLVRQSQVQGGHNGRLLLQVWNRKAVTAPNRDYGVCTIYSDDNGKTWQVGGNTGTGDGANESRLAELSDGRILLESRGAAAPHGSDGVNTSHGRLYSISEDGGTTFSRPQFRTDLPFTACDAGLIAIPRKGQKQALLMSFPDNLKERSNMTIAVSTDDGGSWSHKKSVYAGGACYSDLTLLPDGSIGLLYGKDRTSSAFPDYVVFDRFNFAWLYSG